MTDVNQWRRIIQPSRARTPAWDGEESETLLSPTTPRKATLKPKLSSYFTQSTSSIGPDKIDPPSGGEIFGIEPPSWPAFESAPDAESLIDSVMCRLLASPSERLDTSLHGSLLRIFESYRNLSDEKQRLEASLEREVEKVSNLELAVRQSAEAWERERLQFKAEVKRLELILAKGEGGLAEVTLARQESVLHRGERNDGGSDRTLETIFELLERSRRYEERLFNRQRASMRKRPTSPSVEMRRLSKQLVKNFAAQHDSLADITQQPNQVVDEKTVIGVEYNNGALSYDVPEANKTCSDASFSTCSGNGDLLSDEDADTLLANLIRSSDAVLQGRECGPDAIIPQPTQPFNDRPHGNDSFVDARPINRPPYARAPRPPIGSSIAKQPTLKAKASEFLSKWRTPLRIDSSSESVRRFSFEAGDDVDAAFSAPPLEGLTTSVKDRLLRKSASTSFLFDISSTDATAMQPTLSPIGQSPTTSISQLEERKSSKIPTPVYSAASRARPRSERDSSASSLLTAIKCSDEESIRSISQSGSACSSPTAKQVNSERLSQGTEGTLRGTPRTEQWAIGGNPLIEHTNALRGNSFAVAAARAASTATANVTTSLAHQPKRPRTSHRSSRRSSPQTLENLRVSKDIGQAQKDGDHPIARGL